MSERQNVVRRGAALLLAVAGIVTSATPALGLLLWTLTATPLTATSGVSTNFTLTATNLDLLSELGCLEVDLPPSFTIVGASAGNASNGDEWEAVLFPNKVAVHSLSGGGRLELGQSIAFTITTVPTQAGSWTWPNHAHARQDCGGAEEPGVALAILVVRGPTPTPTPTPTPAPTPTPLLSIEPLPTLPPIEPLPSVLPTLPRTGLTTPAPTRSPAASPTPSLSGTPTASSTTSPSPTQSVAATPPGGAGGSPPGDARNGSVPAGLLEVGVPGASGGAGGPVAGVSLGPLEMIDGFTVWAIPGAIVGGPGLLVILWVLAQTGVALAWIPAVRRLRGKDAEDPGPFSGPRRTVSP